MTFLRAPRLEPLKKREGFGCGEEHLAEHCFDLKKRRKVGPRKRKPFRIQSPEVKPEEPELEVPRERESNVPIPSQVEAQVGYRGMNDALDPFTGVKDYAVLIQNAYPLDPERPSRIIGRPGCSQAGAQLGSAGNRRVQGIHQYTKLDGTEYTVAVVGGKFYSYNWGTSTWTEDTPSAATISTSAEVYFVTFADVLIVSDGTNKPWKWDGTDDTVLTNASVMYGQPAVYYAKLFGIKNTERSTLIWSEEADPTTGYEAGGFNNAWTLGQTDQNQIFAIRGTNEALYYFRARSIGAISGAVTTTFTTDGTQEGVSGTVGTSSPDGVVLVKNRLYFVDSLTRPQSLNTFGGGFAESWRSLRETISGWTSDQTAKYRAVYYEPADLVLLGVVADGTECDTFVAMSTVNEGIMGIWNGFGNVTAMALVKNGDGDLVVMHGTENGYIYVHGLPSGSQWTDALNATDGGTTAIEHIVDSGFMHSSLGVDQLFDRVDGSFWLETNISNATFSYTTSRGAPQGQPFHVKAATGLMPLERHKAIGLDGQGRWIRPKLTHQNGTDRFGFIGWSVRSVPLRTDPGIP